MNERLPSAAEFSEVLREAKVKQEEFAASMRIINDTLRRTERVYWARWVAPSGRWTTCHAARAVTPHEWIGESGFLCGLPAPDNPATITVEWFAASLVEAKGETFPGNSSDGLKHPFGQWLNGTRRSGIGFRPCGACVIALELGKVPVERWVEGEIIQTPR
jgi:hypothetical protein